MLEIQVVEVFYIFLVLGVVVISEQEPLELLIFTPLDELSDLVAHEIEFLARMCHLIHRKEPDARELAPGVSRHPADE